MAYFPMYIDLQGKNVLIVGGGTTALRKLEICLDFGAKVKLVSPEIAPEIARITGEEPGRAKIELIRREFRDSDLTGTEAAVIAATSDRAVNQRVSLLAQQSRIPVNVVDDTPLCTFIFPSIVRRKDVVCGISSSDKSPLVTQHIKKLLNEQLPENIGEINEEMGRLRARIRELEPDQKKRAEMLAAELERLLRKENV